MSSLEPIKEIEIDDMSNDTKLKEEERAKKTVEEIKAANEFYNTKLKLLNEKRAEVNTLQVETFEALQKATNLNEQFNMIVNSQLLKERSELNDEIKKLRLMLEKKTKT